MVILKLGAWEHNAKSNGFAFWSGQIHNELGHVVHLQNCLDMLLRWITFCKALFCLSPRTLEMNEKLSL